MELSARTLLGAMFQHLWKLGDTALPPRLSLWFDDRSLGGARLEVTLKTGKQSLFAPRR